MCVLYNNLRGTREKFIFLGVIVSPAARKLIGVPVRGKCNLGPGPRGKFLILIVELSGINSKKFWN